MANGVYHALLLFMLPLGATTGMIAASGRAIGVYESGIVVYTAALIVVTLKLALESHYWVWLNHLFNWGSVVILWFGFQLIYSLFGVAGFRAMGWDVTFSFYIIASQAPYWFAVALTVVAVLARDVLWKFAKRTYAPQPYHIVQEIEKVRCARVVCVMFFFSRVFLKRNKMKFELLIFLFFLCCNLVQTNFD